MNESIEMRLLTMPFPRMLDALQAIEDLEVLLLERLENEGETEQFSLWKAKVQDRRRRRCQFVAFRIWLEREGRSQSAVFQRPHAFAARAMLQ